MTRLVKLPGVLDAVLSLAMLALFILQIPALALVLSILLTICYFLALRRRKNTEG